MNARDKEKEEITLRLKDFFRDEAARYHVGMAFLYGSWARGYPHPDSDIDLGILFCREIENEDEMFSLITEISYELQKVLNREVNIISIRRDFRRPMLYYNAIVSGTPVFINDYDDFVTLKLEAVYQMEDFQIFGIPWQRQIAQKLIGELSHA